MSHLTVPMFCLLVWMLGIPFMALWTAIGNEAADIGIDPQNVVLRGVFWPFVIVLFVVGSIANYTFRNRRARRVGSLHHF